MRAHVAGKSRPARHLVCTHSSTPGRRRDMSTQAGTTSCRTTVATSQHAVTQGDISRITSVQASATIAATLNDGVAAAQHANTQAIALGICATAQEDMRGVEVATPKHTNMQGSTPRSDIDTQDGMRRCQRCGGAGGPRR